MQWLPGRFLRNTGARLSARASTRIAFVHFALILGPAVPLPGEEHWVWGPQRKSDSLVDDRLQRMLSAGLLQSAEAWVAEQAAGQTAGSDEAVAWALRWSDVRTTRNLRLNDPAQADWAAARQPLDQLLAAYPDQPRAPWLRTQLAAIEVARGQALILEFLAAPQRTDDLQLGLDALRVGIEELRQEAKRVEDFAIDARRKGDSVPTPQDLDLLNAQIEGRLVEALLARAEAYAAGSADALAAAGEALERSTSLLARTGAGSSEAIAALRLRAACQLALEDPQAAEQTLAPILADADRLAADPAVLALMIRIALAKRQSAEAAQWRTAAGDLQGLDPQLALAVLALDAELAASSDPAQFDAVSQQLDRIGVEHGPYWRRRAETLVLGRVNPENVANAFLLSAQAAAKLRDQQPAEAAALWMRAAEAARRANDCEAALQAALQAAAAAQRAGDATDAALALAEIARACATEPRSAAAHAQAALLLAQNQRFTELTDVQQAYVRMLSQHLELWPDDPVSSQVCQWLAQWWLLQGNLIESAAAWLRTPRTSPSAFDAIEHAGKLVREALRTMPRTDRSAAITRASAMFESYGAGGAQEVLSSTERQRYVLRVFWGNPGPEDRAAVSDARQDTVFALARYLAAVRTAQPTNELSADDVQRLIDSDEPWLDDARERLLDDGRASADRLRIATALLLLSPADAGAEDSSVSRIAARIIAHAWRGDIALAGVELKQLIDRDLASIDELQALAQDLRSVNSREAWQAALDLNRRLAAKLEPGSSAWLVARLASAQLLEQLGEPEEALKLARYVLAAFGSQIDDPTAWQQLIDRLGATK
jgi:hypothetical protein